MLLIHKNAVEQLKGKKTFFIIYILSAQECHDVFVGIIHIRWLLEIEPTH